MKIVKQKHRTSPFKIWMGQHKACRITLKTVDKIKTAHCETHDEKYFIGKRK